MEADERERSAVQTAEWCHQDKWVVYTCLTSYQTNDLHYLSFTTAHLARRYVLSRLAFTCTCTSHSMTLSDMSGMYCRVIVSSFCRPFVAHSPTPTYGHEVCASLRIKEQLYVLSFRSPRQNATQQLKNLFALVSTSTSDSLMFTASKCHSTTPAPNYHFLSASLASSASTIDGLIRI